MSQINTANLIIPENISNSWQHNVNLIAEVISVPTALIMRYDSQLEVLSSGKKHSDTYSDKQKNNTDIHRDIDCRQQDNILKQMIVNQADRSISLSADHPISKLELESCHGMPVKWPNGNKFGTICVFDSDEYLFKFNYQKLIRNFRNSIESQLSTLYQNEKLKQTNRELKSRIYTRNRDMSRLNGHLDQEIKKRKLAEKMVCYQQTHDINTGFLNRSALEDEVVQLIKNTQNRSLLGAVIHINFYNGQIIQEQHGCPTWQQLLVKFRQNIGNIDNCTVLTTLSTSVDLVLLIYAPKKQEILTNLSQHIAKVSQLEYIVNGKRHHLNAHIGISTTNDTLCPQNLLLFASKAVQSCKDSGHSHSYYSQTFHKLTENIYQLEAYLLDAIRNRNLLLYFQPKICNQNGGWIGAEALLRWKHPTMGDISSETLINIAEENGLIFELGRFVLNEAIQKGAKWVELNPEFKIAVNISVVQLNSLNFVSEVEELLNLYQLPAENLELEITESGMIIDEKVMKNTLNDLRFLGVTLSLDDFGTGYSSYDYLKKFPFHSIKLDKSFIQKIDESYEDQEIVRSIISIAKKFNLTITAEGIENQKHEEFVVSQGCEYGQGYFYSKPMPCREFEEKLQTQVLSH
ncbi:sensor domain-containing phosphodiesterase [Vibrio zhanjiangensis]|uniref:Sensor domain-containing phosphodiesterase n=1 Tax=Vibrio zhanjiangensis TaxID=1046128 RepID=A0ABQ6F2M3_9VIBR|nr:bifunctional diguanylate cyclase/phosphodiesterase [Vibrio zhanjiangensis]GLT19234.1 sensor domain-containing phosphodiesterase [Vibrio zhanjiangensis]